MARHFTLTEARALLPAVGRLIREAVHSKDRYQQGDRYMQELAQRILMLGGISVDTAKAEGWKAQRDSSAQSLKQSLEKIEEIGVVVKDLDVGLVDFPTIYRGEEVYLCWRMDEGDIGHWHGVHEGFAGRKEIDRHFVENHRGEDRA
jgi:hypothetical protein